MNLPEDIAVVARGPVRDMRALETVLRRADIDAQIVRPPGESFKG